MKKIFIIYIIATSISLNATELTYSTNGTNEKKISLETLKKRLEQVKVTKYYKNKPTKQTYTGFELTNLLYLLFGKNWRNFKEITFTANNKYRPTISTKKIKKGYGYLTYELTGQKSFYQFDKNSNMLVNLGPFYLAWDVKKDPTAPFIYQLVKINISNGTLNKISGGETVKRGETVFKKQCIRCHSLKGVGGTFSKDLAKPNIVKMLGKNKLIKFILNPKSIKPFISMPPLPKTYKNGKQTAEDVIEYINQKSK
jgi:cytochrome c5